MNTYEGARNEMAEAKIKLQGNDYILWAKISSVLDMSVVMRSVENMTLQQK